MKPTREKNAPSYHVDVLGYNANVVEDGPSMTNNNSRPLGAGGEAKVKHYRVHDEEGVTHDRAIKIFHPPFTRLAENNQLIELQPSDLPQNELGIELSKPAYIVASNARFCGNIHNPQKIKSIINSNEDKLRDLGIQAYHLRQLQESFGSTSEINTQGFLNFLRFRAQQVGDFAALQRIPPRIDMPKDYDQGMIQAMNKMARWASKNFPNLMIPKQLFPEFLQFGVLDERYGEDAGKFYVVMEYVPETLTSKIETGLSTIERSNLNAGASMEDPSGIVSAVTHIINSQLPMHKLTQLQTVIQIIHSFGFVFGDLKRGNIGFLKDGNITLLDPSSMIRIGTIQDFATEEFLPEDQQALMRFGQLRGKPDNDIYALNLILQKVKQDMARSLQLGMGFDKVIKDEDKSHETATFRAKLLRNL
ncbi:MAG TPA: hypothetical protein PLV59_00360 [Candidatus Dojkabacteria bacterium]|nr:hypothetical protein [Candidatus Dojkabacteria bacterium]